MRLPLTLLALFSLALPFSYTLISGKQAWLLQSWKTIKPVLPGSSTSFETANWLYAIQEAAAAAHGFTAWVSVGLTVGGIFLAYLIYHLLNGRGEFYTIHFNYRQKYSRLSHNNWYLDAIYGATFIRFGRWMASLSRWIDTHVLDWLINGLGVFVVVGSNILAWVDRWLVDGLVNLSVWTVGRSGQVIRGVQSGHVQRYLIILTGAVLILLLWWVI